MYCDPVGLADSKSITCDNAKSGTNYPLDTGVSKCTNIHIQAHTIRLQLCCNGRRFQLCWSILRKCVETMQKGLPFRYGVGLGITVSKGQETARCVSEHSRKLSIEEPQNQRQGRSNYGESVPSGYICHASEIRLSFR